MAKVILKDKKSLENAKKKVCGLVDFRQTKNGIVAAKQKRQTKQKPGTEPGSADS